MLNSKLIEAELRIYASVKWFKKIVIGSDNGLLPGRHQAIIWTNAGILLIGPLGTICSDILIKINTIFIQENTKIYLKISSPNGGHYVSVLMCLTIKQRLCENDKEYHAVCEYICLHIAIKIVESFLNLKPPPCLGDAVVVSCIVIFRILQCYTKLWQPFNKAVYEVCFEFKLL